LFHTEGKLWRGVFHTTTCISMYLFHTLSLGVYIGSCTDQDCTASHSVHPIGHLWVMLALTWGVREGERDEATKNSSPRDAGYFIGLSERTASDVS
jgi:hypothetical protein